MITESSSRFLQAGCSYGRINAASGALRVPFSPFFSLFSSLFLSLCFLCKGLPLKDENGHEHEHEPLVQARQHRTAIANGMSSGGMGGVGIRHHGGARMSPLEIGMYVLLAAFCFAIVVFVVSCVVYASKFKPQPPDSPLAGAALPVLSGAARARAAANQLASGRRPPRESTTNAHDWVWLGRATLERAACGPQQVCFASRTSATSLTAEHSISRLQDWSNDSAKLDGGSSAALVLEILEIRDII